MVELPVPGLNTGSTNGHSHLLLRTGRTSIKDEHSHTWKTGAQHTGVAHKHTHALPGASRTGINKRAKR